MTTTISPQDAPQPTPRPPTDPRLRRTAPDDEPSSRRRWFSRGLRLLVVAAAITASFFIDNSIFTGIVVLFAIVAPFEKLYPRQKGQKIRRPLVTTDIAFALAGPLLNVAAIAAVIVIGGLSFFWLPGLALRPLVGMIPAAVLPFVGFLLFDFVAYWTHRWAHEVPFMWRFHAVHHSPEHMDWVSGFRIHPFDGVLIAPGFFFLLGAGFDAELAGVFAVFQIILGIFFHANVRVRWRWVDKIACNPEFHHWHHANEADSIGHNYGAALPWWDLAFGTFFMPKWATRRRPQHYGIDEYLPRHMLGQLAHPCRGARRHLWLWRHPIIAAKTVRVAARNLLVDIHRSSFRPTRSVRRETRPGSFSTNASLIGPSAAPKPVKLPLPSGP